MKWNKEQLGAYAPNEIEMSWYDFWEKNGYFHQDPDPSKESFSIVMPPPNVTGQLHMGHALDNTLQDILVRFKRMEGYNVAWIPGTDHAGIATQVKVEQLLPFIAMIMPIILATLQKLVNTFIHVAILPIKLKKMTAGILPTVIFYMHESSCSYIMRRFQKQRQRLQYGRLHE